MVTLRCTHKLLKFLGVAPTDNPPAPTGRLGDWYANLIPTYAGDLIMFVNEETLITVAVPTRFADDLIPHFRARVRNLFLMLDIPLRLIEREINHYEEVEFAKTASRSVLGSMNDIAYNYQYIAERDVERGTLSLSDAEYQISKMPSPVRDFIPDIVARDLLGATVPSNGAS